MIGKVIYSKLSVVEADCYPNIAPQGTALPYITYSTISCIPHTTKNAVSDYDEWRVQIDILAASQSSAETLAKSCRTAMDMLRGTVSSVSVINCWFDSQMDLSEPLEDYYHIEQDYIITTR